MDISVDSNILVCLSNPASPFYLHTATAVSKLLSNRNRLYVFPQIWWSSGRSLLSLFLQMDLDFRFLKLKTRSGEFYGFFDCSMNRRRFTPNWQRLVSAYNVSGKNAHDARIVAQMNVHNLTDILTFNIKDFSRYGNINVVDPATV